MAAGLARVGGEGLERKAVPDGLLPRGWLSSGPSLPMTASSLFTEAAALGSAPTPLAAAARRPLGSLPLTTEPFLPPPSGGLVCHPPGPARVAGCCSRVGGLCIWPVSSGGRRPHPVPVMQPGLGVGGGWQACWPPLTAQSSVFLVRQPSVLEGPGSVGSQQGFSH